MNSDIEDDDQVIVSTALDYTKLEAINQRRQTEHINKFLLNTVHFINTFSAQVEMKFQKLETNLQRIEADFAILDSKLRSTPGYQPLDLVDVVSPTTSAATATTNPQAASAANTTTTSVPPPPPPPPPPGGAPPPPPPPPPPGGAPPPPPPPPPPEPEKVEDPRLEKYRKMLAMRVPAGAVRHKMLGDGVDQALIESLLGPG